MEILSKNHLSHILHYKQKKFIERDNLIIVEGYRLLSQISLYDITFEELYVSSQNSYDIIHFKAKQLFETPNHFLKKISSTKHPANIAALIKYTPLKLPQNYKKLLYLDNISDPGNFGTIIRSALAFGFDGIITSPNSVSYLNDKVIRASLGAVFALPIYEADYKFLSLQNANIIVADNSIDAKDIRDFTIEQKKIIIVIGSEAFGVSDEIMQMADYKLKIPLTNMESLNAAISAAIFMYKFYENR